jgi:hypothetical protein
MIAGQRNFLMGIAVAGMLVCGLVFFEVMKPAWLKQKQVGWGELADIAERQIAEKQYGQAELTLAREIETMKMADAHLDEANLDYDVAQKELVFCLSKSGDAQKFQTSLVYLQAKLKSKQYDPIIIDQQFDEMAMSPEALLQFVPLLKARIADKNNQDQFKQAIYEHNLACVFYRAGLFEQGGKMMPHLVQLLLDCDLRNKGRRERMQAIAILQTYSRYLKNFRARSSFEHDDDWHKYDARVKAIQAM